MNRGFIAPGIFIAALVVGGIIWPEFFDLRSLLITLGGSLVVTWFSYSGSQLRYLAQMVSTLFDNDRYTFQDHVEQLARLARLYCLEGLRGLENQERHLADPFLTQAVKMLVDLEREDKLHAKLERELAGFLSRYDASRQILLTLGRLLPTFGLIGTLTGMVLLLRNVSNQDPQGLTSAISIAFLTTLYGAVLANVVVAPIAARLQSVAVEREMSMRLTIEWVVMLARGQAASVANRLAVLVPPRGTRSLQEQHWSAMIAPTHR